MSHQQIMRLIMRPEIGYSEVKELSVAQPFSILEENGNIAVYLTHDIDDDRWKRKEEFIVLGTGDIPEPDYGPIGTVKIGNDIFHVGYRSIEQNQ
ncbi:hypothetical protein [Bacillus cereus]|uniref:hypothetical protein n=1 Tax=Bacillus cereus group TaxID=86661 RepID=UPI002AC2C340|nr:hypothetical protein [Bacillus cereus]MDZ4500950.1 hypothetical protein [Bacillus cereus]MDZ4552529.1 hypothetical protein [Bacillus cereus]